jgi:hypothetical protein
MIEKLKHLIKKYFWKFVLKDKISTAEGQNQAFLNITNNSIFPQNNTLNIFTKNNEDGILLSIIRAVGCDNNFFLDIGSNDCIISNCANLAFNQGWQGYFIDGNKQVLDRGRYIYKKHFTSTSDNFCFINSVVTVENINSIISQLGSFSKIDLLCIDLDGNDYFIWEAINVINPKIVLVEVQVEKGSSEFIPESDNDFELFESNTPKGASPLSMTQLAHKKGYELVSANKGCFNLFFVKKEFLKDLKPIDVEKALTAM